MSKLYGTMALNLEMSNKVPRTEYSVEGHFALLNKVLGTNLTSTSTVEEKQKCATKFIEAWDYGIVWNVLLSASLFDKKRTKMGHANYANNATDFSRDISCPFKDIDDVFKLDFEKIYGEIDKKQKIKELSENYKICDSLYPTALNMTGIYVTIMSGLIEIMGWELLLCAAGEDIDALGEFTNRYAQYMMPYFEAMAECDSDVIMVHDDIVWSEGAFLNPNFYHKYIFPNYVKYFELLKQKGKKILYTCDGNFTQFIDDIANCGVNGFVLEPMTDMAYIAKKYGKTHVFVGNADTRILLSGTKEDIYKEVKRCMDIGRDCPGFIMAVGNHIPSNTPVDNALWYNEFYEKLSKR